MPIITTEDGEFEESVPYGSDWQSIAEYYPTLPVKFGCRNAECGVCAIRIIRGSEHLTKIGKKEEATLLRKGLTSDYRLACQCAINGNVCIGK
ncbi:MAG: (2Fe-2S)-binding protein [Parachlamydiaceae bacterium]|nr:(2Fe-2S)-binding protein [Parachlamydiaceae bacterium]